MRFLGECKERKKPLLFCKCTCSAFQSLALNLMVPDIGVPAGSPKRSFGFPSLVWIALEPIKALFISIRAPRTHVADFHLLIDRALARETKETYTHKQDVGRLQERQVLED